ncbi:MAG: hypothetical protein M3N08_02790 [Pseudomonadota bacterium]|nr:hypothetical protein [Pseudomonadota bacterium]
MSNLFVFEKPKRRPSFLDDTPGSFPATSLTLNIRTHDRFKHAPLAAPTPEELEREAVVLAHRPLAAAVAAQFKGRVAKHHMDDVISVAELGLIKASLQFDIGHASFSENARQRMREEVEQHIQAGEFASTFKMAKRPQRGQAQVVVPIPHR